MRLAVLADTHGRVPETVAALSVLNAHAPDVFLHCGDVGGGRYSSHGVLTELARVAAGRPAYLVPGNNDRVPQTLAALAAERGLHYGDPIVVELAGVRVCVTHGTRNEQNDFAEHGVDGLPCDLVCSGHTHLQAWEEREFDGRPVRLLNPGACWRAAPRSVALVDLPAMKATFLEVPRPE